MTDPTTVRPFLEGEIEGLEPLDFLVIAPCAEPQHVLEVARDEDGTLQVRVPGRPALMPELPVEVSRRLRDGGFTTEDADDRGKPWHHEVSDAGTAVELVRQVLTEIFQEKPDVTIDVIHGSRRAEHEARQKYDALRVQLHKLMMEIQDPDLVMMTLEMGHNLPKMMIINLYLMII